MRYIARGATICTAISEDTKKRARELHGVTQEIVVTHLGLEPASVPTVSREELEMPADKPVFVSIGRLIARKGYHDLLEAWRSIPNAHLIILGQGFLQKELERTIVQHDLADRVQLRGYVSETEKLQLLRQADGYVSAAEHEGFGIVFLEAMEAGLAIVATNNGGHTDFLKGGENALLVDVHDVDGLQKKLQQLIDDSALRQRMAETNKEKVKQFYLDKTTAQFENVLTKAYEGRD